MPNDRIILGIDPGYGRVGYGAISVSGPNLALITYGCITTTKAWTQPRRLQEIAKTIRRLLKTIHPDLVAVEKLFFAKNARTALGVSEARGVITCTVQEAGYPTVEFTPAEIKLAVTGHGRAEKRQVQLLVERLLKIKESIASDDAADALGIAICAAQVRALPKQ
jgi:crossover junction endodeoxyribonuclease RuvC